MGASELEVQRSNRLATLPPDSYSPSLSRQGSPTVIQKLSITKRRGRGANLSDQKGKFTYFIQALKVFFRSVSVKDILRFRFTSCYYATLSYDILEDSRIVQFDFETWTR